MNDNEYSTELIKNEVLHPVSERISGDEIKIDLFNIGKVDTTTLRRALAQSIELTARHIVYLAAIWGELERRGEDLSALRSGLSIYLPQIADGTLDAELVIKYAGQRMLLHAMSKLPIHTQRDLARSGQVTLARVGDNGEMLQREVPLKRLSATDVRFAFSDKRLRPLTDQWRMISNRRAPPKIGRPIRKVVIEDGDVCFGGRRTKIENVLEALSEHFGVDVETLVRKG